MIEAIIIICLLAVVITAMIYYLRQKIRWVANDKTVIVVNDIRYISREGSFIYILYNDGKNRRIDFITEENAINWIDKILKSFN